MGRCRVVPVLVLDVVLVPMDQRRVVVLVAVVVGPVLELGHQTARVVV
jgi:hypothetical protein